MATFYEVLMRFGRPYYFVILTSLVFLFFLWFAYYSYKHVILATTQSSASKHRNIYQPTDPKTTILYLFYADWCPACQKAKPEFDKFKAKHDGRDLQGQVLKIIEVECSDSDDLDDPASAETARLIEQYQITAFPTIKLVRNGTTYSFESKVKEEYLEKFIESSAKSESA